MKRVLTLILTALLLFTVTALAESPAYTPEMAAQKVAIAAVKVKYGLTTDLLGLFTPQIIITEADTRVAFYPASYLPVDRIGVYEVVLTDSTIDVHWTHDGQDPYLWQSDDIFSEYWGARQLQTCLNVQGIWRFFVEENQEAFTPHDRLDGVNFTIGTRKDASMYILDAYALADAAVMDMYGLTIYEAEALEHDYEADVLLLEDGTRLWRLTLASPSRCFSVFINDATGEVFDIIFSTSGNG